VIKKPRERGGHSPRWAAEPEKIIIITTTIIIIICDVGTINSSDRIAATLYSLGTLFVSEIYV
jgi:hypothetical protein